METLHKTKHDYTDCHIQITGQSSAVIIREDGHCEPVTFRRRIAGRPRIDWVRLAAWLIPAAIWLAAMLMSVTLVVMTVLGKM